MIIKSRVKKLKLADIANLNLGFSFKSKIEPNNNRNYYLLQPKDFHNNTIIRSKNLIQIQKKTDLTHLKIANDSLVMKLRGPDFNVGVLKENSEKRPIITTNQVAVITCNKNKILPFYLLWFLNSNEGQRNIQALCEGTNISKLSTKALSNLLIDIPSIELQYKISLINENRIHQTEILHQKQIIDNIFYNQLFKEITYNL